MILSLCNNSITVRMQRVCKVPLPVTMYRFCSIVTQFFKLLQHSNNLIVEHYVQISNIDRIGQVVYHNNRGMVVNLCRKATPVWLYRVCSFAKSACMYRKITIEIKVWLYMMCCMGGWGDGMFYMLFSIEIAVCLYRL